MPALLSLLDVCANEGVLAQNHRAALLSATLPPPRAAAAWPPPKLCSPTTETGRPSELVVVRRALQPQHFNEGIALRRQAWRRRWCGC